MADNHTKEGRSYNMSRIRSENTSPEEIVRKFLFSKGLRYRKNDKRYLGHPDIVLPKFKIVIFINGCFWHMHENCDDFKLPKTNQDYWIPKLMRNKQRDAEIIRLLESQGWMVIVVWECELKKKNKLKKLEEIYTEIINHKED